LGFWPVEAARIVPVVPAVLIFTATHIVSAIGKLPGYRLDRAGAALLGAALMVAFGRREAGVVVH
jgi:hypothetical protein